VATAPMEHRGEAHFAAGLDAVGEVAEGEDERQRARSSSGAVDYIKSLMHRRLASVAGGFLPGVPDVLEELSEGGHLGGGGAAREVVHFH